MTPLRPILACLALTLPAAPAQDIAPKESERDPVLSALSDGFGESDIPSVSVDISATAPSLAGDAFSLEPAAEAEPAAADPVPPEESEPAPPEPEGVSISVEAGADGSAKVDATAVKLLAPFPAKPLFQPPVGWRLEHPEEVPTFIRQVPLANGTRISLAIRPHLLVPDADGDQVLAVNEPGYDPTLRYAQTGTTGAVLAASVERMEEDSRKMSDALDRLSQLLSSLPATEAPPAPEPSPAKKPR
jgi:hypothetical protein